MNLERRSDYEVSAEAPNINNVGSLLDISSLARALAHIRRDASEFFTQLNAQKISGNLLLILVHQISPNVNEQSSSLTA